MKETVHQPKNSWLVGAAMALIAIAYFFFLGASEFPEPGVNIEYDLKEFEELDKVETHFVEADPIPIDVKTPVAMAAVSGKLYIAGENEVAVYSADGKPSARFTIEGAPTSIGADPDGTVYVALRNKVGVFDNEGVKKAEWTDFTPRSYITAIAPNGSDVYIADAGKRVVYRFDKSGKLQTRIGEKDDARDVPGLEVPSPYLDVAINGEGDLWVVNPGKLGLERYREDGSIVTSWYRPTVLQLDGFPGCCNPTHIAFTSKGELITSEKGLVRIKKFEVTSGAFEGLVAGSTLFPREQSIKDIAVDAHDRILVLDTQRSAIRIFAPKETDDGRSQSQPA